MWNTVAARVDKGCLIFKSYPRIIGLIIAKYINYLRLTFIALYQEMAAEQVYLCQSIFK